MQETVEAVYENGVLKLLKPLPWLREHAKVQLTVSGDSPVKTFSDWVGTLPDDEASRMLKVIEEEFERVDPNEWK